MNHLLTISSELIQKQKLDFEILHPLIIEQINKSLTLGPDHAQTGPAVREDLKTLDSHLDILKSEHGDDIAEIYKLISQNIIDHYS